MTILPPFSAMQARCFRIGSSDMAHNPDGENLILAEYKILSEDRREAVKIFVNATWIATVIIGFSLKYLVETKSKFEVIGLGGLGLAFFGTLLPIALRCRRHDSAIHARLNNLGKKLQMQEVMETRYIFNSVFIIGGFLLVTMLSILAVRLWRFQHA